MIDPTFRDINRLLIISSKSGENLLKRNYFENYYMPSVDIKDFNELIDIELFFDQHVKSKQKVYGRHLEMSRNN